MPAETSQSNLPAKVGDKVKVTIKGPTQLGHGVFVKSGGCLTLEGVITGEDSGIAASYGLIDGYWIIRLTTSFNGDSHMMVPKANQLWMVTI